jgi:hypothetical protein
MRSNSHLPLPFCRSTLKFSSSILLLPELSIWLVTSSHITYTINRLDCLALESRSAIDSCRAAEAANEPKAPARCFRGSG